MMVKPAVLTMAISLLLASCGQLDSPENTAPETAGANTTAFPVQPMQVLHAADLRLSYIGKTTTDTSKFYQVVATYEGRQVGFNLSLPAGENGRALFFSRGGISDDFLHLLRKLYGQKPDTMAKFTDDVGADCIDLSNVYKADSGYAVAAQKKLFFKEAGDSSAPELFLNVDDKEHMIELWEKDSINRIPLLRRLTKSYGN